METVNTKLISQDMVNVLVNGNQQDILIMLKQFRNLCCQDNPPINEIIQAGLLTNFSRYLESNDVEIQIEALWILITIVSGNSTKIKAIIEAGCIPLFIKFLESNYEVQQKVLWTLGLIANESVDYCYILIENGFLQSLFKLMTTQTNSSLIPTVIWCLSNLYNTKQFDELKIFEPIYSNLAEYLYSTDEELLSNICSVFFHASNGSVVNIQKVKNCGICKRLIELLTHNSINIAKASLRVIDNICTGSESQTQELINLGVLDCLLMFLSSPKLLITKEACWIISNITAGNSSQVQAVIEARIFPKLIEIVSDEVFEVRKEAIWAIANATTNSNSEQIKYLAGLGIIPLFCDLFKNADLNLVNLALEALWCILNAQNFDTNFDANLYSHLIKECGEYVCNAGQDTTYATNLEKTV